MTSSAGKRVLIDCGASNGSALPELITQFGPFDSIWAIEPNPENSRHIHAAVPHANVIEAAVFSRNGSMKLYLGEQFDGSTLYADKLSGGISPDRYITVQTLDFSEWLNSIVEPADFVVCKMDIEGAEFDVLEHVLATRRARLVNIFLIEWHVSRFPDRFPKRIRRFLIKLRFRLAGVKLQQWR